MAVMGNGSESDVDDKLCFVECESPFSGVGTESTGVVIIEFDITLEAFQQSTRTAGIHPVYKQAVAGPDRTGEKVKLF